MSSTSSPSAGNRLVLDGYDDDQPVYRRVSNRTVNRTVSKLAAPDHVGGTVASYGRANDAV